MVKVAILGSTGYVGEELVRLLAHHPRVTLTGLSSHSYVGQPYSQVYPQLYKIIDETCIEDDITKLDADVLFVALPHGIASKVITKDVLKRMKVIDLGADFRISKEAYDTWYKVEHFGEELLKEAVYGLSEWNRNTIKDARLIANPGCYVTCSLMSLMPLLKEGIIDGNSIIIDAKSGVTGAGRGTALPTHYTECNESIKAYGVLTHRHTPEIEEQLENISGKPVNIIFTPHLVPMNRGILATIYANLTADFDESQIEAVYKKYYEKENFVRLLPTGTISETRWVKGSNYCDISFKLDPKTKRIVVVGAIDNLMKGAAGQAVQNMNIMMGWEETLGIDALPMFPA